MIQTIVTPAYLLQIIMKICKTFGLSSKFDITQQLTVVIHYLVCDLIYLHVSLKIRED